MILETYIIPTVLRNDKRPDRFGDVCAAQKLT